MKRLNTLVPAALTAAITAMAIGAAHAHHSFAMFDRDTQHVKSGTVQRWAFNNPHSWLYVNVKNPDGTTTLWSFEGSAPTGLITRGITGDTFKPGATVTFMFCPLKDGRPGGAIGWANRITEEAIRNEIRLSDVIRRIVELPVAYPESVQIPVTLSDADYQLLAIRYGMNASDKAAIKSKIIGEINEFSGKK